MPKEIRVFRAARLIRVEPVRGDCPAVDRERYVGKAGRLVLEESVQRRPGARFLYFTVFTGEWSGWLQTGYGELAETPEGLVFTTQNNRYTFELLRA